MENIELIHCPEVDRMGNVCGAIAEIVDRFVLESTDGPVEHLRTRCIQSHILTCLAENYFEQVQPPEIRFREAS
jgi:hypothetical protein